MVQLEFAASVVPQLLVCEKSPEFVPVNDTARLVIAELLPLVSVNGCAALELPTPMLPKLKLLGDRDTFAVPVPVRLAVCVPALSFTVSVPVRVPVCVGVKVT